MDKRGLALAVVVLAAVMDLLDGTVVNIVLPSVQRELGADNAAAGWIASGYTLALGVLLTLGGRLGDRYGPRRVLTLSAAGFGLASLACGVAISPEPLITARVVQGAASALLTAFGAREHRRFQRELSGLVPTGLFRLTSFTGAVLVNAAVFGLFFTLALYLQRGLGFSPLQAAAMVLPWALGIPATSLPASRWLVARYGRHVLETSVLVLSTGLVSVALMLTAAPSAPAVWQFGPGLFVAGCGMGLVTASVLTLGLAEVPHRWAGLASGVLNNMQHLAGALGITGIAAVHFTHLDTPVGMPASAAEAISAFRLVAWILVGLAAVTVVATRLMPRTTAAPTE